MDMSEAEKSRQNSVALSMHTRPEFSLTGDISDVTRASVSEEAGLASGSSIPACSVPSRVDLKSKARTAAAQTIWGDDAGANANAGCDANG